MGTFALQSIKITISCMMPPPPATDFDFELLGRLTTKKHRLAFECYAELSEKIFADVPMFQRDAFDASFFHHLSSCNVEEAYEQSKALLSVGPERPITVSLGAQSSVDIVRFIQGRGEPPLPSLDAVTARWFNLPSNAFDDPKVYEVFCQYLVGLVASMPAARSEDNDGPWQPWQLGSLIFWYTKIQILRQRDFLPHELLAGLKKSR